MKQILKNKKGMIKNYLIGLVVLSMIIAGISTFYISTTESYNVTDVDTNFSSTYSVMGEMENMSSDMQSQVSGGSPNWLESTLLVTKGVWATIQLPFKSISWIINMTADSQQQFGLPSWLTGGLIIILTLAIIFAIVAAVFKIQRI